MNTASRFRPTPIEPCLPSSGRSSDRSGPFGAPIATTLPSHVPHPLQKFRLKADIDWVDVVVEFSQPTNFHWVRTRLPQGFNNARVYPPEERPENCRSFKVRILDPRNPAHVENMIRQLDPWPALFEPERVRVVGVGVSLDALPRGMGGLDEFVVAAEHLLRHQAHPPMGRPVISGPGGDVAAALRREVRTALGEGFTISCGDEHRRGRVYVKRQDTQVGENSRPLPEHAWSVRMEAALTGPLCPFHSLEQWSNYQFKDLVPYFRFVKQLAPKTALLGLLRDHMVRLGKPRDFAGLSNDRRSRRQGICSDGQLNQRIMNALRALSRRTCAAEIQEGRWTSKGCSADWNRRVEKSRSEIAPLDTQNNPVRVR